MRADRLLSILLLLQKHPRITTGQLAAELDVSTRTIQRDMDAMSGAGIPVYAERGRNGGWQVLEGYRTTLTGLNDVELQSLFLGAPQAILTALGISEANQLALLKLEATLADSQQHSAAAIQNLIHIDVEGWHETTRHNEHLPAIQSALWNGQALHMTYQRGDGTLVERAITPFGLVAKGLIWYVVADNDGTIKTYRLDRIQTVEPHGTGTPCPDDFDLAAYWQESKQAFRAKLPRVYAKYRAHESVLDRLQHAGWYSKVLSVQPEGDSDWHHVEMAFNAEADAVSLALSFGAALILLDPAPLREQVIQQASALLDAYTIGVP